MSKKFLFLISLVLVVTLTASSYAVEEPYVIGHWENDLDGWEVNEVNLSGLSEDYSTTVGVTEGSYSLKLDVNAGYNVVLVYDLLANSDACDPFKENTLLQLDVTRRQVDESPYEWSGPGTAPEEGECTVGGGAFSQLLAVIEVNDGTSKWIQLYETGEWQREANPTPENYHVPFVITYDYNTALTRAGFDLETLDIGSLESLEILFVTNWGNYDGNGVYYLDNARLTNPPPTTTIGDFELPDLDGWKIFNGVQGMTIEQEYSNGITLGDKSLKITAPTGWSNGIILDLITRPGGLVDKFRRGTMISADITRKAADWTGDSEFGRFSQLRLVINGGGTGWGFWMTTISSRTSWPIAEDYPGDMNDPVKCYFDYTPYLPYLSFDNMNYLEIFFSTNRGDCWDTGGVYYLDNVQLHTVPAVAASNPQPVYKAADVTLNTSLSWDAGLLAQGHNVWFGNSEANMVLVSPDQDPCSYDPSDACSPYAGLLLPDTNYYWRIDEHNDIDDSNWPGELWQFKTGKGLNVDSFDSYNVVNGDDELDDLWKTYSSWNIVSLDTGTVHSSKSMKFSYENWSYPYFAEAEVNTLLLPSGIGSDWSFGDSNALTLYFYGRINNDANEQMYVKLYDADSNAMVTYDGDVNAVRELYWHQWNINLADFTDIDMDNVTKLAIGFGDGVAPVAPIYEASVVYFDDVRLYVPRCVPDKATADVNGDCFVDYTDLGILTNYWLIDVCETAPSEANLVGKWMLNGDATDTGLAPASNGILGDGSEYTPDWKAGRNMDANGWSLGFKDNEADYVNCGNDASLNLTTKATVAAWIQTEDCGNGAINTYVSKGHKTSLPYATAGAYGLRHNASNKIEFFIYQSGTLYSAASTVNSSFNDVNDANGVWHFVAGTYDGSYIRLYIDGILTATTPRTGAITTNTKRLLFGASEAATAATQEYFYEGRIDEVRIYSRALSQAEIMYLAEQKVDLYKDGTVDFLDFAKLAEKWLDDDFWPAV